MHHWRRVSIFGVIGFVLGCMPVFAQTPKVVINEIHYDPDSNTNHVEFVELYNAEASAVDLSAWQLGDAIDYVFPQGTLLESNAYLVVSQDPGAVQAWFGVDSLGPFEGKLNNTGECVTLVDATGQIVDTVDYKLGFPWPTDTEGRSMELIYPDLDNDLGGSWRASDLMADDSDQSGDPTVYIPSQSENWSLRKGTSEPDADWFQATYDEDTTWQQAVEIPFGYDRNNDYDFQTVLSDMSGTYVSVYVRSKFYIDRSQIVSNRLTLRVYVDDGCIAYLNGQEVARFHVSDGDKAYSDLTGTNDHEATWEDVVIANPQSLLKSGVNVLAVHVINHSMSSSDFIFDCELLDPGYTSGEFGLPTPGARNSVWSVQSPPQIRQVKHTPPMPRAGEVIRVTAKVTDPDQVQAVNLWVQTVAPGHYVPAYLPLSSSDLRSQPDRAFTENPAFENSMNWTLIHMRDDGQQGDDTAHDDIYTGTIPAQINRTLVRYRIEAVDLNQNSVRVPYKDDEALNFACYVYNGIPPYTVQRPSQGWGTTTYTYSPDSLTTMPVYTLITRAEDITQCYAYSGADQVSGNASAGRKLYNWEGAFVYDGEVYDHVRYRLRGANGRYHLRGKRSMKFRFNRGHDLEARDRFGNKYPEGWRKLNVSKLFDNRAESGSPDQNYGLPEMINSILFNLAGVPTWHAHWFHFRVVDGEEEAPDQYDGDFWGMFLALEEYDAQFLKTHGLPDGNLYKLSADVSNPADQIRFQGPESVDDYSDYRNVRSRLSPYRSDEELKQLVNYDVFYRYYALAQAIRHYDSWNFSDKNIAWYFEPQPDNELGRLWYLPWDVDLTWGPNWNEGEFEAWWALGDSDGKPQNGISGGSDHGDMRIAYRNTIREIRDLLWNKETVNSILDELAFTIDSMAQADQDRWKDSPNGSHDYDLSLAEKVEDMKIFAWEGGKTWSSGNVSGYISPGGQTRILDLISEQEGDKTSLPETPTATYVGPVGYPLDMLVFQCSPFQDPQGSQTFAAVQWRIAEVSDLTSMTYRPEDRAYEIIPLWQSEALSANQAATLIDSTNLLSGHQYRVRVRMKDDTERWSHWSDPVTFYAGQPLNPVD